MNAYKRERERERHRCGTTLIEVMVALSVVSITIVGSVTIVSSAFTSLSWARDRLIAENLVYEGLEVVENTVDTNLIRYSDLSCWNLDPAEHPPCIPNNQLNSNYRLIIQEPSSLEQFDILLDKSPSGDLDLSDETKTQANEAYRISVKGDFNTFDPTSSPEKKTKFYRMIKITYDAKNNMNVESDVQWKQGNDVKTITVPYTIYKYKW